MPARDAMTHRSNTPLAGPMFCSHCDEGFEEKEKFVNTNGEALHQRCFACAQCFKPFDKAEIYYESWKKLPSSCLL